MSTSWFVPKPHTAFQWEAQITMEEYQRRVKLLRDARCGAGPSRYNWHDPETSFLEAVFSRGDRRLADVIGGGLAHRAPSSTPGASILTLTAGWTAFAACGLDPAFYANRVRDKDEVFPWCSHLAPA